MLHMSVSLASRTAGCVKSSVVTWANLESISLAWTHRTRSWQRIEVFAGPSMQVMAGSNKFNQEGSFVKLARGCWHAMTTQHVLVAVPNASLSGIKKKRSVASYASINAVLRGMFLNLASWPPSLVTHGLTVLECVFDIPSCCCPS